jgi:hypothetical protein
MLTKFPPLASILLLSTLSATWGVFCPQAHSQENYPPPVSFKVIRPGSPISFNRLINQAFSQNSGDFYEQASALGQLNFLFGWADFPEGSYSENSLYRDSLLLSTILDDYFQQLVQREPTIRTRDLENPFNSSLYDNSNYTRND